METPWTRARKTRSEAQETRLDTLPGGRKGVNSGRFWRFKRDGTIGKYLIEARTNEKPTVTSYRIEEKEFRAIERDARQTPPGLRPAMQIQINDLRLMVTLEDDWLDREEELLKLRGMLDAEE